LQNYPNVFEQVHISPIIEKKQNCMEVPFYTVDSEKLRYTRVYNDIVRGHSPHTIWEIHCLYFSVWM